jgi:hypothetical membrane protein
MRHCLCRRRRNSRITRYLVFIRLQFHSKLAKRSRWYQLCAFLNVPRPAVSSPITVLIGQGGLVIAGLFAIIFAFGLLKQADSPVYRLGAVFGIVGTAGLCASGIFPAPTGMLHLVAVYTFGLLAPTAMFLIGSTFIVSKKWLAGLSITLGLIALAGTSMISYGRSVAELVLLATVALWAITLSVRMLQQTA